MTQGVLYIATGEKYVREAIRSAKTINKHCPGMAIHLFTDPNSFSEFIFESNPFPFTSVEKIENPHRRSKVDYMVRTPYEQTLFLDADTAVNADIRNIFDILDRFDIALVHAMIRNSKNHHQAWQIEIPDAFPEFNSGVVLFRKTTAVLRLFEDWREAFTTAGHRHDQPTLRELLWSSDLRIATLPPEYNVRFLKYHFLWSKSEAETKIFHLKQFHDGWFHWVFRKQIRAFKIKTGKKIPKRNSTNLNR